MKCEDCGEKPAMVHITCIQNGTKTEKNLCEECAKDYHVQLSMQMDPFFSVNKLLASLLDQDFSRDAGRKRAGQPACPHCGLTYQDFTQMGRLGCSECYRYYSDILRPLLRRVHGSEEHIGKIPRRTQTDLVLRRELSQLRSKLQLVVANEEFEEAARIRDQIRKLEQGG